MHPELDELRGRAAALGIKVDGRWSAARLAAEIEAAQPPAGEEPAGDVDQDDQVDADTPHLVDQVDEQGDQVDEQPVLRVGGHVNRDDGRGWVPEE